MANVKIKLRKEPVSVDWGEQHGDYAALLKKHERHKRYKHALQWFLYTLVITVILLLFVLLALWLIRSGEASAHYTAYVHTGKNCEMILRISEAVHRI